MHTTSLRKVGGSVMMVVPPDILEEMSVHAGSKLGLTVEDGKLIASPSRRRILSFEERLAMCDLNAPYPDEDHEWNSAGPVGREIL